MREILTAEQTALLERLFAPQERWGWEYREPEALPEPFPHPCPVPYLPWPDWASQLGPQVERAESKQLAFGVCAAIAALIALAINLSSPGTALFFLAVAGVLAFFAAARPWLLHRQAGTRQREWMEACIAAHDRYREQFHRWAAAKHEHQQRELARLATSPEWGPIRPGQCERIDLYGGTFYGWEAFITTAAAPLVAAGAQLTIVDLSQHRVAAELTQLAELSGYTVDTLVLPGQMPDLDLFAGLTAEETRDVIVEAVHGDEREASHETRSMDARIIGGLCESLAPALTLGRICAGLRVLIRQEPPPPPAGGE